MDQDQEHLRLLSIFHYVVGGLAALFACFPLIHLGVGIMLIVAPDGMSGGNGGPPPAFIGWFFVLVAGAFMLFGWTFAVLLICAGRFLAGRKHYTFCLVIAALSCMFMPFGTVLGVFTIIVLLRPSVKELFAPGESMPQTHVL